MSYIEKTDVEKYSGIAINSTLNSFIAGLISTAEDYIERYCGDAKNTGIERRRFEDDDADKTYYYNGNGATKLSIDDIRTITSLTVDFNGGSETELTENDDYYLYPLNAVNNDEAFTQIQLIQPSTRLNQNSRLQSSSPYIFDEGQRTVKVIGKFGFSTTPPEQIKTACMKIVLALIKENIGDTDLKEITSENLGDYSANFVKVSGIADRMGVNTLLEPYKRKSAGSRSATNKIGNRFN